MRIPESELIINADGSAFHIHMRPEDLADIVVVFGDPGRVKMFESLFDTIEVKEAGIIIHIETNEGIIGKDENGVFSIDA